MIFDSSLFEDLPEELKEIVLQTEKEIKEIQQKQNKEIQEIQQKASEKENQLKGEATQKITQQRQKLLARLAPLQVSYTKEGKLDEALAIREQVRKLKANLRNVKPDPGSLLSYHNNIGESFLFEVIGTLNGPVWGTDTYTSDSDLSTAAVHAGVLQKDEKGVIKVTLFKTQHFLSFEGTLRNKVHSSSWGPYKVGYKIEKP